MTLSLKIKCYYRDKFRAYVFEINPLKKQSFDPNINILLYIYAIYISPLHTIKKNLDFLMKCSADSDLFMDSLLSGKGKKEGKNKSHEVNLNW